MSPFESWLIITFRLPFLIVILLGLLLATLIAAAIYLFRKQRLRYKTQSLEIQSLQAELANLTQGDEHQKADQEVYRQFIYNISHEVANPLQSIQTNLDNMVKCAPEEVGRWQQTHQIIAGEIRRLSTMTENLRLLSRLETPDAPVKLEPINIKAVVEDVMMAQVERAEAQQIHLAYNGPNRPARVLGNRDQLRQVLMNLVDNSIKYAQEGGGQVTINVQDNGDRLHVRVIDNGIGISEEDLPYIFDTAYRAPQTKNFRRAGTGLGLAIVKRIVEQHGGQVQVHSQPGEGTTISFDLPLYSAS
jgi:signal transduction histidine kinase